MTPLPDIAISVLCPTRGRPELLQRSLGSLLYQADHSELVEVLIATDRDDPTVLDTYERISGAGVRVTEFPARLGYKRLHEYVNALAATARGRWLLNWNDDAVMQTDGWDSVIMAQEPGVLWLGSNETQTGCNIFPAWPRAWTDAMGHVSLSPHCDTWMQEVGSLVGRQWEVPVRVTHDNPRLTGRPEDLTYRESLAGQRSAEFYAEPMAAARRTDAEAVRACLAQC